MWRVRVLAVLVFLLLAGCLSSSGEPAGARAAVDAWEACRQAPTSSFTWFFAPGHHLAEQTPDAGAEPGNAFSSGFLTNDLKEWLSDPVPAGLWVVGNVTLEYWVRSTGSPAPLAIGGEAGEGYHFFNQFGSDRTLQPSYATEYSTVAPLPGAVDHYTELLPMPEGGFVVEAGDSLRVLLTDLALDGPQGSGHEVLFGGDTPSQVRLEARCFPTLAWPHTDLLLDEAVSLPGNQGLLTGRVPPTEGLNLATFDILVPADAQRLTVRLSQDASDANQAKDDIDLELHDAELNRTWGIGSPYSDEQGALWQDNLAWLTTGNLQVRVNSYSGIGYTGRIVVTAERAVLA